MTTPSSIDQAEIAKFEAMAAEWWDPNGKFRPLHLMNPLRLDYIRDQIAAEYGRDRRSLRPFAGLRVLDIGCGGGLASEPMARLGADVVGADATQVNIAVAQTHADQQGLAIDYQVVSDIRSFEIDTAKNLANIEISVKLLNDRNGTVKAQEVFRSSARVSGSGNANFVKALDQAFAAATREIVAWTLKSL